jgi:DNA-binding XRE family transcriptional regulator
MDAEALLDALLSAEAAYRRAVRDAQAHGPAVVRATRDRLGLTQRGLASLMGVSPTTLSKIERGHYPAGRPLLTRLARVAAGLPAAEDRRGRAVATS